MLWYSIGGSPSPLPPPIHTDPGADSEPRRRGTHGADPYRCLAKAYLTPLGSWPLRSGWPTPLSSPKWHLRNLAPLLCLPSWPNIVPSFRPPVKLAFSPAEFITREDGISPCARRIAFSLCYNPTGECNPFLCTHRDSRTESWPPNMIYPPHL